MQNVMSRKLLSHLKTSIHNHTNAPRVLKQVNAEVF